LFQSIYQPAEGSFKSIPLMPEWYLFSLLFGGLACLGFLWQPLLWLWPVFLFSIAIIVVQAVISAAENSSLIKKHQQNWKYPTFITLLHIIQPLARLKGRINHGLTPWRIRGAKGNLRDLTFFLPKILTQWLEGNWKAAETWLEQIEQNIISLKARVKRGGDFDRWDLRIRIGIFSTANAILTIEEHGANKQYLKFRYWVNYSKFGLVLILLLATLSVLAAADNSWIVSIIFAGVTVGLIGKYLFDCASVASCMVSAFTQLSPLPEKESAPEPASPEEHGERDRPPYLMPEEQTEEYVQFFSSKKDR
jgi:hypothetical protein